MFIFRLILCWKHSSPSGSSCIGQLSAGKGRFHGPNLINFDTGLFKNTPINEKINTQFRAEFFNVFNRTNVNDPGPTVRSGNFGRILSAMDPRIIQLGFKVTF